MPYILLKVLLLSAVEFIEWTDFSLVKTSNRQDVKPKGNDGESARQVNFFSLNEVNVSFHSNYF